MSFMPTGNAASMLAQAMQGGGGFAMPQHPGYGEAELAQAQAAASSAGRQQDLMQAMFANGARDRHMGWGDAIAQLAYAYGAHKAGKKHDSALADVLAKERGLDKYDSQLRAIQEQADEQRRRRESMEDFKAKENFKRESAGPSDYDLFSKDPESYAAYKAAGRAPGTTVNVNSGDKGPQVGTIPQGFQMVQENGAYRMEAIPGGPADIEAQEQAGKAEAREEGKAYKSGSVLEEIEYALGLLGGDTAGVGGAVMRNFPGSDAKDFEAAVNSVRGNLAFDQLQQMREASPTGGALGAVSERELGLLESTIAGYDPNMSEDAKRRYLNKIRTHYGNWAATMEGINPDEASEEPQGEVEQVSPDGKYVKIGGEWFER